MVSAFEKVAWVMRRVAFLFVGLLLWGLADDFLVNGLQHSPRASANDDDEYLLTGAKSTSQRLVKEEKAPAYAAVTSTNRRCPLAEASHSFPGLGVRAFSDDSRLYVFMSLQI
jgi:hypothetical protein